MIFVKKSLVELGGIEPLTLGSPIRRLTNWATEAQSDPREKFAKTFGMENYWASLLRSTRQTFPLLSEENVITAGAILVWCFTLIQYHFRVCTLSRFTRWILSPLEQRRKKAATLLRTCGFEDLDPSSLDLPMALSFPPFFQFRNGSNAFKTVTIELDQSLEPVLFFPFLDGWYFITIWNLEINFMFSAGLFFCLRFPSPFVWRTSAWEGHLLKFSTLS